MDIRSTLALRVLTRPSIEAVLAMMSVSRRYRGLITNYGLDGQIETAKAPSHNCMVPKDSR
jgi:hypothetical protein